MGILACLTTVFLLSSAHAAKVAQDECSKDVRPELVASLLQNVQPKPSLATKREAPATEADRVFDELDLDNDGQLSKEEFQRYQAFEASTDAPAPAVVTTAGPGAATTAVSGAATTAVSGAATTAVSDAATTAGSNAATTMAAAVTKGPEPTAAADAALTTLPAGIATVAPSEAATSAANVDTTIGSGAATASAGATTMMPEAATGAPMATDAVTMMPKGATTAMPDATELATAAPATVATAAPAKPAASKVAVVGTSECCGGPLEEVQASVEGMKLTDVSGALPGGMKYEGVFPGVDMVVMAVDAYVGAGALNGIEQGLGAISLKGSSNTTFKFRFHKSGTEELVSVDELYLSFVDLDKSQDLTEQVELLTGFDHVYVDETSSVKWTRRTASSPPSFTGTVLVPGGMPIKDMKKSVSWRFMHVPEIMVKLTASGGNPAEARVFYFTGKTRLTKEACLRDSPFTDITFDEMSYSNLAGHGPSVLSPHGLMFKGVKQLPDPKAELGYKSIDLTVMNTEGRYEPQNPAQNGLNGKFGSINFQGGTKANFSFKFVAAGEVTPVENVVLTFFDVEKTPAGTVHDSFIIHGISKAYLSENSKFQMEELGGSYYEFSASFKDDKYAQMPLPSSPFHLTPEQQARSFAVEFTSAAIIDVTVDMTSVPEGAGRTIYFAGQSRLSAGREMPFVCLKSLQ